MCKPAFEIKKENELRRRLFGSELHVISTEHGNPMLYAHLDVSMLFRAPRHFY